MKKYTWLSLVLLVSLFALAACGGGGESTEQPPANEEESEASGEVQEIQIEASNFTFDQEKYVVKAGQPVKISLKNAEGMHGIAIDELDVDIQGEGTAEFTPDKPGEYVIYCNVYCGGGHSDMKSTLVVQ